MRKWNPTLTPLLSAFLNSGLCELPDIVIITADAYVALFHARHNSNPFTYTTWTYIIFIKPCCCLGFRVEETEAQRELCNRLKVTEPISGGLKLNPSCLGQEAMILTTVLGVFCREGPLRSTGPYKYHSCFLRVCYKMRIWALLSPTHPPNFRAHLGINPLPLWPVLL